MSQPQSHFPAPCSAPPGTSHELSTYLSQQFVIYPLGQSLDQILANVSIFSFEGHALSTEPPLLRSVTAKENRRMNRHGCV